MKNRILLGFLVLVLVATTLVTFYKFASSPTDENIFTDSPGKFLFTAPVKLSPDSGNVEEGDILAEINGVYTRKQTLDGARQVLEESLKDSVVAVGVNQSKRRSYGKYRVRSEVLRQASLEPIDSTVIVVSVAPGGASDRAGMLPGDIIERINRQRFSNAQEADRILRRASSGGSYTYEVLRGKDRLTLNVVLAGFGFPLANLIFSLAGLVYIGIGAFIAMKRPELKAARLLGLGFMLSGFVIAVWTIRRDPDPTLFVTLRAIGMAVALFFGIAVSWHSAIYFPREREELISRRWITRINYGLAFILTAIAFYLGSQGQLDGAKGLILVPLMILVPIVYNVIIRLRFRHLRTPEYVSQREIIKWTGIIVGALCSIGTILAVQVFGVGQIGFVGLAIVLIPLAHLYTIGRYRLLDMNLRIRRNTQYSLVSVGWGLVCAVVAVGILSLLLSLHVRLPEVSLHGTSIEVRDPGSAGSAGGPTERFLFIVLAFGIWYVLWRLRKAGQRGIDKLYSRTQYDYRRALSELSEMLATKLSMADLGHAIVEKIVHLMQLKRAGVFFFRDESVCCCREAFGIEAGAWQRFCLRDEKALAGAVRQFAGEFTVDYLPEPLKSDFRELDFRYIVPIRSKEHLIGAIVLGEKLSEATFSQEDLEFLSAAARQASVSIENAFLYEELAEQERMKHELEIARRIQMASLPQRTPVVEGLEVAGESRPAMEVGGDFFDYLNGSEEGVTVIVGDVSGKGTSAALYMSKVQGILRSLHDFTKSPAELFIRTNRLLSNDLEKSSFITALGAAFDTTNRRAIVARAGHLPLYWYRKKDGSGEKITTRGLGLGLDNGTIFAAELEERIVSYEPGDVMAFVTDGIVEARNEKGEEFGEEQLLQELKCHAALAADEIRSRILERVSAFAGLAAQHDDQTLVVVKVR